MAAFMATAARSSGRVVRSVPLPALPTAVRTELTITASLMGATPSACFASCGLEPSAGSEVCCRLDAACQRYLRRNTLTQVLYFQQIQDLHHPTPGQPTSVHSTGLASTTARMCSFYRT